MCSYLARAMTTWPNDWSDFPARWRMTIPQNRAGWAIAAWFQISEFDHVINTQGLHMLELWHKCSSTAANFASRATKIGWGSNLTLRLEPAKCIAT